MSRIGKMPISVPAGVDVKNENNMITVKGPKGTITKQFAESMNIEIADGVITVTRPNDEKTNRSQTDKYASRIGFYDKQIYLKILTKFIFIIHSLYFFFSFFFIF